MYPVSEAFLQAAAAAWDGKLELEEKGCMFVIGAFCMPVTIE